MMTALSWYCVSICQSYAFSGNCW